MYKYSIAINPERLYLVLDPERLNFALAKNSWHNIPSDYLGAPRIRAILVRNKPKTNIGRSSMV